MKKIPLIPPAPGAAITEAPRDASQPREQITQMLAPENEKDFAESLPESTTQPVTEVKPKRTRRSRAEMEAARGQQPVNPAFVGDAKLEKIKAKFSAMGGGDLVKGGFSAMQKPLTQTEQTDVEDYFYMVAAKGGIDPMKNWITMFATLLALLLRLVLTRTDMFDKVRDLLFPEKKKENEKATTPKPESEVA